MINSMRTRNQNDTLYVAGWLSRFGYVRRGLSESVFKLRSEIQGGGGDSQLKDPEMGTNLLGSYVRGTKTRPMCLDLSRGKIMFNLFYASICFYFSGSLATFHLIDIFILDVRTKTFFFNPRYLDISVHISGYAHDVFWHNQQNWKFHLMYMLEERRGLLSSFYKER